MREKDQESASVGLTKARGLVFIADRGGHLNNALMLKEQMGLVPEAFITTTGPEVSWLRQRKDLGAVRAIPMFFTWFGKRRFLNPFKFSYQVALAIFLVLRFRPAVVISLGASNVVPFCYLAKLVGAKVYHVECMNQVVNASRTGRLLQPICAELLVQWEDLLPRYPEKGKFEGWVL